MLRLLIPLVGGMAVTVSGCAPAGPQGTPNSTLTVPDVPPAGPNMKKGPLDPKPGRPAGS